MKISPGLLLYNLLNFQRLENNKFRFQMVAGQPETRYIILFYASNQTSRELPACGHYKH